jgi:hypothetical protein
VQLFSRFFVSRLEPQRFPQMFNRLIPLATLRQHSSKIALGLRIVFIGLHGFRELFERFVRVPNSLQRATEIVANLSQFDRVTLCLQCSAVTANRIGPAASSGKGVSEIELHLSRLGFDRRSLSVMRDSFIYLPVSPKSRTKVVMGIGIAGV